MVDAYDAMTNHRPYGKVLTQGEAIAEIEAGAGSQFDLSVVEALKTVLNRGGPGQIREGVRGLRWRKGVTKL